MDPATAHTYAFGRGLRRELPARGRYPGYELREPSAKGRGADFGELVVAGSTGSGADHRAKTCREELPGGSLRPNADIPGTA